MASQAGQDAKFFQRGKIQVRCLPRRCVMVADGACCAGIPRGAAGGGVQGQEVCEEEDSAEEDCGQYHYGERQSVRFARFCC